MTKEEEQCEACSGKGWLDVSVDGAEPPKGMIFLQRCDTCNKYHSDFEAGEHYPGAVLAVLCRKEAIYETHQNQRYCNRT